MHYFSSFLVLQTSLNERERMRDRERERERERERDRTGCFAFIVFRMSCNCKCSMALLRRAVGWPAVYFLITLTFCKKNRNIVSGILQYLFILIQFYKIIKEALNLSLLCLDQ